MCNGGLCIGTVELQHPLFQLDILVQQITSFLEGACSHEFYGCPLVLLHARLSLLETARYAGSTSRQHAHITTVSIDGLYW